MEIEDALHGYINLNDQEKKILDTPQVQRLRRIRQLGLSSLVYPSATHTRFQHSLGVMHLAGEFADSLKIREERKKELRIAGLLHDSGHGPFSHASEVVSEEHGVSHEQRSCRIVEQVSDNFRADEDRIKKIIKGELEIGQVVAGDIDADRMDYLMRDAHGSGINHGHIDYDTIIRCAEIDSRRLVFNNKAVSALESLFTARFHMINTLYYHHAAVIAEKMLQEALRNLVETEVSVEEMMQMDDYEAHCKLMESEGASKRIYSRIKDRNLYKRALVWDSDTLDRKGLKILENRIENTEEIEKRISEAAGVNEEKVILDVPKTPEIKDINVKIKKNGEVRGFEEFSPVPNSLRDAEWRNVSLKVYCPEEELEKVQKASEKVLKRYRNRLDQYFGSE